MAFLFIAHGQAAPQAPAAGGAPQADQAPSPSQPAAPQSSRPQASAAAAVSAEGELVEVDLKANTITLKTATAPEMKFKFDDSTKVTGGQKGVAGLATMKGSQVTIQYTKDGATNMATSITVRPAAGAGAAPRSESPRPEPAPKPVQIPNQ